MSLATVALQDDTPCLANETKAAGPNYCLGDEK